MAWIRILDWRRFQHYKDRSPPWIKLHREQILDHRGYRNLSDSAQALLVDLWMLGSENDGRVRDDLRDLEFRLRRPRDEMVVSLQHLADAGFIALPERHASNLLTDASAETPAPASNSLDRGEESRGEKRREERGFPEMREAKAAVHRVLTGDEPPAPRIRKP